MLIINHYSLPILQFLCLLDLCARNKSATFLKCPRIGQYLHMLLSRKRYSLLSSVTFNLQLGPNELERVSSYRCLGVIITDNLTWDEHISHMCAKARQLIGLFFFRRFAKFLTPTVLIKLYKVLIRPPLEYCSYVWDPFTIKLKQQIESVQKFALRVCLKHWDMPYSDMLELTVLPTLESRRSLL